MNKINDDIANRISKVIGAIPKELQNAVSKNYEQRSELCSLIFSEMSSLDWIDIVKDSFDEDPEFPSVYFTLMDRMGKKKSYSRITPKINGKFYIYLNGSNEALSIAKMHFKDIARSPMIRKKIKEIKESSTVIIKILKDNNL
jgi:hypothetical protein